MIVETPKLINDLLWEFLPVANEYDDLVSLHNTLILAASLRVQDIHDAEIRRQARQRCLDELEAYSKGGDIEAGVGSDVERAYLMLIQRHGEKEGFSV